MKTPHFLSAVTLFAGIGLAFPSIAAENAAAAGNAAKAAGSKVDINTADIPALEAIPEIGTNHANAVVAARPFQSVEDLEKILKLGPDQMNELRRKVTASAVKPAAAMPPEPPPVGVTKPSSVKAGKATPHQEVTDRYDRANKKSAGAGK